MGVAYADASKVIDHLRNRDKFAISIVQYPNGTFNVSPSTVNKNIYIENRALVNLARDKDRDNHLKYKMEKTPREKGRAVE